MAPDLKLRCGWPFPDMSRGIPTPYIVKSAAVVPFVGTISKIWLCHLNSVTVHNGATFSWWVNKRPLDQPLITVSNHHSCLDDPLLYGVLPWQSLWSAQCMRWSLAAHDVLFTRRFHSWFFSAGKCVPCIRGEGVFQHGMDFCCSRLREGCWVHIFPEGKVNEKHETMRLKWGIGRLVYDCWAGQSFLHSALKHTDAYELPTNIPFSFIHAIRSSITNAFSTLSSLLHRVHDALQHTKDAFLVNGSSKYCGDGCEIKSDSDKCVGENCVIDSKDLARFPGKAPIILLVYHLGMDSILPNTRPFVPRVGNKVTVVVGEPLDTGPLLAQLSHDKVTSLEAMKRITDWIEVEFRKLGVKTAQLHAAHLGQR
ncbi:Phospholipid/glycerol acyltransferase [Trinorchestia longiramus]|nr:Phospholipid/glycerol acyltransferase [Trinorchestia longiramus]